MAVQPISTSRKNYDGCALDSCVTYIIPVHSHIKESSSVTAMFDD